MQRRWQIEPDIAREVADGAVAVVSQDALAKAMYDAAIMLDRAGGVITVLVGRIPTGFPGEMVTTGALVEWKDRTDARPQAEARGFVGEQQQHVEQQAESREDVDEATIAEAPAVEAQVENGRPVIGDGLDDPPADVDESSVPERLRA